MGNLSQIRKTIKLLSKSALVSQSLQIVNSLLIFLMYIINTDILLCKTNLHIL